MKWLIAHIKWIMLISPRCSRISAMAGLSKAAFILLVLTVGQGYLGQPIRVAVVIDAIWVLVFAAYLVGTRSRSAVTSVS